MVQNEQRKEAIIFYLAITLLHEFVHYGTFINKLPDDRSHAGIEAGDIFENDAFGINVHMSNAFSIMKNYDITMFEK